MIRYYIVLVLYRPEKGSTVSETESFLGNMQLESVMVADGQHDGLFVLHLGAQLNRTNTEQQLNNELAVEGLAEVIVNTSRPAITGLVSRKKNGEPRSYQEIKRISSSFVKALSGWAVELTAKEICTVTERTNVADAFAHHSDTVENKLTSSL